MNTVLNRRKAHLNCKPRSTRGFRLINPGVLIIKITLTSRTRLITAYQLAKKVSRRATDPERDVTLTTGSFADFATTVE